MRFVRLAALGLLPTLALATASEAGPVNGMQKLDVVLRASYLSSRREPVALFVKTTNVAQTEQRIRALGGTVGVTAGDIVTARLPPDAVAKLADMAVVSRLEGARAVRPTLDKVRSAMKVDQLHSGAAGTPYRGKGVVVGVLDWGLDLDHDAFKKPGGASRVIALWDQAATTGTPPTGFTYGAECSAGSLAAKTCAHTSTEAHGTHVTGIAAGNAVGGSYVGVAPEADIVFVSLRAPANNDAFTTSICEGAAYVFKVAAAAGKPAVVNMSLGEQTGPRDGSSLADQCLDNLAGPGKILIAAAGNGGEGGVSPVAGQPRVSSHVQLSASSTPTSVRFLAGKHAEGYVDLEAEVWFDAPSNVSLRVGAVEASGTPIFTSAATIAAPLAATPLVVGTHVLGRVTIASATTPSGARALEVVIADENGDQSELNDVSWILELTGSGKVDAFIDTRANGGFLGPNPNAVIDNEMTIGFPAIARNVLAVGSYVTRNEWTPLNASLGLQQQLDPVTRQQVVLGALSPFSSHGPPRRTTIVSGPKPDITAPGEVVASALNAQHVADPKRVLTASPSGYVLLEGTSIASPAVAGAVALMLQKDPTLDIARVRVALDTTAVSPGGVTTPSPLWGRGKMDALAALQAITVAVDAGSSSSSSSSSSSGSSGDISSTSSSSSASSSGVVVSSSSSSATSAAGGFIDDNEAYPVFEEDAGGCAASRRAPVAPCSGLALLLLAGTLRRCRRTVSTRHKRSG